MNVLWVASLLFVCLFVALLFFCFFCYIFLAKSNELRGRARRNQLDMQIDCGAPILFFLCVVFSLVCYFCIFFCPFLHSIPLTSSRTGGKKGRQWGWGGVGKKGIREMKRRTKRTKEEEDKEEEEEEREEEKKRKEKRSIIDVWRPAKCKWLFWLDATAFFPTLPPPTIWDTWESLGDILGRAVCPSSRLGRRWSEGGTPFRLR